MFCMEEEIIPKSAAGLLKDLLGAGESREWLFSLSNPKREAS